MCIEYNLYVIHQCVTVFVLRDFTKCNDIIIVVIL